MAMSISRSAARSTTLLWAEISQQLSDGLAQNFDKNIHDPQKMNPSESLTFPLAPPWHTHIHVPLRINPTDFADPFMFSPAPSSVHKFNFVPVLVL